MATIAAPVDHRVVLYNISWDIYERLVTDTVAQSGPRFTYDRGTLEIMSPGAKHERDNSALSFIVWTIAIELGLNFDAVGAVTYRRTRSERGFEADSSFYLLDPEVSELPHEIDGDVDPPPDLVIEIEYSRSSLPKLELFASLQVPEVWRWDGDQVTFHKLVGDHYEEAEQSRMIPVLSPAIVADFVTASQTMTKPAWRDSILEWVRST